MNEKIKSYAKFSAITSLFLGGILFASTYLGIIVQKVGFIQTFDKYFYNTFANGYHNGLVDTIVFPVNNNFLPRALGAAPSFLTLLWVVFLLSIFIINRKRFKWALLTSFIGVALAAGSTYLSTRFVDRSRPFLTLANKVPQNWQAIWIGYTSWPSGHVRDTAVLATIVGYFFPKTRWFMVALVVFVAWSRLYLGAHYPTDVIGGAIIGYMIGTLAIYIVEFVTGKFNEKKK